MGSCGRGRGAGRRVFNVLTTSYLFLGGTGAGALAVLCVLECARVLRWRALAMPEEFFARAWPMCTVTLATGMLCLLVDLGRPDRLLGLFASPAPSVMAAGSFALVAALACAAAFSLGALLDTVRLPRAAVLALAAAGALSAAVTATYTGVLLESLASVLLWRTPLVPVLFTCSSLSCGAAVMLVLPLLCDADPQPLFARLSRIDGALLALEAVVLTAFMVAAAGDVLSSAAAQRLLTGDMAPAFWGALAAVGIAAPFALEAALRRPDARACACIGVLVLIGGFFLRYCLCTAPFMDIASYL